ncbi:alpha/beta fold hydrolase [Methylotetracoccus oryzae]|uniref:alpha/beta fold hydrolase n=1 Tax=Methylotetracoccus oryzae TaxID=1919059 RepID=UPI00111A56FA|nr:alpha/beta hydrolase [Methylotetracoccus oryzae]
MVRHTHGSTIYEERRIRVPDGLLLYARDYLPQTEWSGRTLLCLHGLTRNSSDFDDFAPAMASSGHRVLTFDMRGRGRSDKDPQWRRYMLPTYAGDVAFCLDTLVTGPCVFLGASMGGLITMILAGTAPQFVSAAVLNDVGPVLNPAGLARIVADVGNTGPFASWRALAEAVEHTQGTCFPGMDEAFWQRFARRVGRDRSDGWVEFAYDPAIANALATSAACPAPDLRPLFAALARVPVLVVRGADSDILTPAGVAEMRRIKPDLEVVEVPGVGHAPTLSEPEAMRAIQAFLRSDRGITTGYDGDHAGGLLDFG